MPISLRLLSFSMACMIPISSLALTLGKVDVQSAIDEPLRATVNVNNIAVPLTQLKAGVATASAYSRLGASRQSLPNLRFLLKDLGQGNAQMWIVSNERISEPFVDLVIHITEGDQITTHPLPLILAAPDSSAQQIQLERRVTTPPIVATNPSANSNNAPTTKAPSKPSSAATTPVAASTNQSPRPTPKAKVDLPKANIASSAGLGSKNQRADYKVKNRETLSGIASRYSQGSNLSLDTAMSSILALNPSAFINNNPNLIKANAKIQLPSYSEASGLARQLSNPISMQTLNQNQSQPTRSSSALNTDSPSSSPSASAVQKSKSPSVSASASSQSKASDLKLDIVSSAPKPASADATAKPGEATSNLPAQLSDKVAEVRKSTILKRQSVNQMITQLNTYNTKIKLQNARLAELESKLKSLNSTNN